MRIVYMYHEEDPLHGSIVPGSLPNPQQAFRGYRPLSITQRQQTIDDNVSITEKSLLASSVWSPSAPTAPAASSPASAGGNKVHISELRNDDVKLPAMDTLFWCKVFEFQEFSQKQHLVKVSKTHSNCSSFHVVSDIGGHSVRQLSSPFIPFYLFSRRMRLSVLYTLHALAKLLYIDDRRRRMEKYNDNFIITIGATNWI